MLLQTIQNDLSNKLVKLNEQDLHFWYEHFLFHWRWWIGILLIIIPLILWIKFRNKESADRLHYAGLLVALISSNIDYVGHYLGKWRYDYEVVPFVSNYVPISLFVLPVIVMFLLQIKPRTHPFIKALIYAIISLIALPILKWIGVYVPIQWNYMYSFVIQFFVYLIAHFISKRRKFKDLT